MYLIDHDPRVDTRLSASFNSPNTSECPIVFLLPGSLGYGPSLATFGKSLGAVARIRPIRYPDLQMILAGRNTLHDMADAALEQINRIQPSGHVRLLGHSLGGAVAFEVAARLLGTGQSVEFFGILDTSLLGERSSYWETLKRTFNRIQANRVTTSRMVCRALAKAAAAFGAEVRLAGLLDRYAKGQFVGTCFRIKQELQEVMRARAFFAWLAEPKPVLPISATLFRCNRKGMPQYLGWDRTFASVDVIPVAGSHTDLFMQPHLATNRPLIEGAVKQTYSPAESPKPKGGHQHDCASDSQPSDVSLH